MSESEFYDMPLIDQVEYLEEALGSQYVVRGLLDFMDIQEALAAIASIYEGSLYD